MTGHWSHRHTLLSGLLLILGVNAAVLAGVAYNRSGEPDAVLQLTDREFHRPGSWGFDGENSGLQLPLKWRLLPAEMNDHDYGQGGYGGQAAWLDRAKLSELGFDMTAALDQPGAEYQYEKQLPREVLLVLEMDGPAHQAAIDRARQRASRPKATRADADLVKAEMESHSRLFVVDAGLDHDALQEKYPEHTRYAIAKGKVAISFWESRLNRHVRGYVSELSVSSLNVPLAMRDVVARDAKYIVAVPFGRRLEPWIASARAR
jgi:hypothetical protein